MDSKVHSSIFESGFDSFEFDDGFLMKVDSDLKKNKINEKHCGLPRKYCAKEAEKTDCSLKRNEEKTFDIKAHNYDLPLFIEDLNDSDFFESNNKKNNNNSPKKHIRETRPTTRVGLLVITSSLKNENEKKQLYSNIKSCLSPIQDPELSNKVKIFSSTPIKSDDDSIINKKSENIQKESRNLDKPSDFDYLEADLFDDWDVKEINKELDVKVQRDTITFSQALKLIEEAESEMGGPKESLNRSVDLLTGEIIGFDVEDMFEDPFDLPPSEEKKQDKETSNDSVVVIENFKRDKKPLAAQKLTFELEKKDDSLCLFKENNVKSICFNSDDDFDFMTQELLKKPKKVFKCAKPNKNVKIISKAENSPELDDCDPNESTDAIVMLKKKEKKFNIIESDSTEDSPSPKFRRQSAIKYKKRHSQENFGREFIDSEAEVSGNVELSSDEAEEEGEYDKSFLDEGSYFTQNRSADMTAKYLESVKNVSRFGNFKIPSAKSYDPSNVFSQIPENNTDYEIDSFCVNEVDDEIKTDLSDLEVAEKLLEMDRKKRKKKRSQKVKKCK